VVFSTGRVGHAHNLALDAVIQHLADICRDTVIRDLSLGSSTLFGDRTLYEVLYRYKLEFGAGSIVHETFDLRLD
jgi:hypothetical protein